MHELALCESVMRILYQEADRHHFTRIKTVRLQLGALSCVAPEAIDFCFKAVSKGTMAEGARLELLREPGAAWCAACGETVTIKERYDPCPSCGSYELHVSRGDELRVKDLEVE
ncbi:MAG: hydrogenase maturation nickel metallochaperone HypA [Rhodospirillales bacterium]|nr:MAG: hydrogenase maturation nickel metallochaperone HypA [Rhodospirillales bacterium]